MSTTKQVVGVEEKYKVLVDWIARCSYWRGQKPVDDIPNAPTSMASASPFLKEIMRVVDEFDYEVPQEGHEIKILNRIICDIDIRNNDPSNWGTDRGVYPSEQITDFNPPV